MTSTHLVAWALALGALPVAALGQPAPAGTAAASAAVAPPAAASAAQAAHPVQRRVLEDDGVRIEELLWRGQPQRVTVHSKVRGGSTYEINVGRGGRDPSQESGKAGQSAWRLFDF